MKGIPRSVEQMKFMRDGGQRVLDDEAEAEREYNAAAATVAAAEGALRAAQDVAAVKLANLEAKRQKRAAVMARAPEV